MARLIGTAGHVDHGKTSLIQALTGINADRLPEEKTRGLTIDVGFAHIDLPDIGRVSIVDVPGHERFVTNMLVGALGIDVALLCVAADESVMPQTIEHLQILDLLPVESLVVAMTRADLADSDLREITMAEIRESLASTRFSDVPIVPVSVVSGEGLDQLRVALRAKLEGEGQSFSGPWYLPIDRVFTVKGHGTVVTGTLMAGQVEEGTGAVVQPLGQTVRIRQIQRHDESATKSEKGHRTALNLGGVRNEELHRGMVIGTEGFVHATSVLDARVRFVVEPKHGTRIRLSIGADEVIGKIFLNDFDPELVQLRLERPTAAVAGQPLIIRRYSPPVLMAGGRVVVPVAEARRKNQRVVTTQAVGLADQLVDIVGKASSGLMTDLAARLVGQSGQELAAAFEKLKAEGRLLSFAGLWFTPESFEIASRVFLAALKELHQANLNRPMLPREIAVKKAGLDWAGKPLDRILGHLAALGRLRIEGSLVAHSSHRVALEPKQRAFLDRVKAALDAGGSNPPSLKALAAQLNVPIQAVEGVIKLGLDAGEILRLDDQVFFTTAQIERSIQAAKRALGDSPFTAAQFKEALGTSRKFAIPLLEHSDSKGWTVRRGDQRVFTAQPN